MRAVRRSVNPKFYQHAKSRMRLRVLASLAKLPFPNTLTEMLRSPSIATTPLNLERLHLVADAVGFPRTEIFLDEDAQ